MPSATDTAVTVFLIIPPGVPLYVVTPVNFREGPLVRLVGQVLPAVR